MERVSHILQIVCNLQRVSLQTVKYTQASQPTLFIVNDLGSTIAAGSEATKKVIDNSKVTSMEETACSS